MDNEICVSNMKKYVAFYKYKGSGNHSHGVILIIFKWIAFFPVRLPREKSDIAWSQSKPCKIHPKKLLLISLRFGSGSKTNKEVE